MVKFDTYVGVFIEDNKMKFVTDVSHNEAEWASGKPALKLSESYAEDIVYGLTLNGFPAAIVRMLYGVELSNEEE